MNLNEFLKNQEAVFNKEYVNCGVTPSTPDYPPEGYDDWACDPSDVRKLLRKNSLEAMKWVLEELFQRVKSIENIRVGDVAYVIQQINKELEENRLVYRGGI